MTDIEITKLCAEAMGMHVFKDGVFSDNRRIRYHLHLGRSSDAQGSGYDPLHDDLNHAICECVAKMQASKEPQNLLDAGHRVA